VRLGVGFAHMRGLRIWLIGMVAYGAGLVPSAAARGVGWSALRRPLHVPHLEPGAACPVSHSDRSIDFARFGIARGIGPGPAYPIGMPRGVLAVSPATDGGAWAAQKVLWFVDPSYHGPVLVRGRRLDGPGLVRFDRGVLPAAELRLASGTTERPSFTRLRALGCYAYQIDGVGFSRVIVFRATGRLSSP
jgi:hypothetical protein